MMINMAVLLIFVTISVTALIFPYKHPEMYNKAQFKIRAIPLIGLIGLITSSLFLVFILRLPDAMPGFLLLLTWIVIGSAVYIYTQEKHQLHWRLQKQQRKAKDDADKVLIKELVSAEKDKIIKKKK